MVTITRATAGTARRPPRGASRAYSSRQAGNSIMLGFRRLFSPSSSPLPTAGPTQEGPPPSAYRANMVCHRATMSSSSRMWIVSV